MARIDVDCRGFVAPFDGLNGRRCRDVTVEAVLRAIVTVGFQRLPEVLALGWRGLLHRFGIALSSVSFLTDHGGHLCVSDEFARLDMSEKAAASYWYGVAFAKLIAESELSIPWLAHVDSMRAAGALRTNTSTSERGDLVGTDRFANWHVVEAKGRSSSYARATVDRAKRQAARITLIKDAPPTTTSACITRLFTTPITVELNDPAPEPPGEQAWLIADEQFFAEYYRGIITYLRQFGTQQRGHDDTFVVASIPPGPFEGAREPRLFQWPQLRLGLRASIFDAPGGARSVVGEALLDTDGSVGGDGIMLIADGSHWGTERAR